MSQAQLKSEILKLSHSRKWDEARREWKLNQVIMLDDDEESRTCLCGHFPIRELCLIFNTVTGTETIVGNCCIKRFIGLPSDLIFQGIKRILQDPDKAMNEALIDYASSQGWLNEWETNFCYSTLRKRNLSTKQSEKRSQINARVLSLIRQQSRIK